MVVIVVLLVEGIAQGLVQQLHTVYSKFVQFAAIGCGSQLPTWKALNGEWIYSWIILTISGY